MKEKVIRALPGIPVLLFTLVGTVYSVIQVIANARHRDPVAILWVLAALTLFVAMFGCFQVQPNQGAVLTLFGKYKGTVKDEGLRWANPFYTKKAISLRTRNFETKQLKVNDHDGNPIEIAAVVVWRIVDTAEAVFQVDNYENYIAVQSEAALRNMATAYPYDAHNAG